ncbi:hypothetical protein F5X68DRAFT_13725 [Plectosphaerella plurivora]|uniref:GATA-type domain-containing protein n=1 Tax=Plectosphaerella plurivora TaxID=936078 RepID=A0A9P9ACH5_9PEZI|nr:hypothetical protein F5X68DRAFT_13725 [Plectosphaerella plurivora]
MPLAPAGSDHDLPPPAPPGPVTGDAVPAGQHALPALSDAAEAQVMAAASMQRIHHGAYELLRFSEIFPGGTTSMSSQGDVLDGDGNLAGSSSGHAALRAMSKSSDGIVNELRNITALAARAEGAGVTFVLPQASQEPSTNRDTPHTKRLHGNRRASGDMSSSRKRKNSIVRTTCHECHRAETPQWRPGPDGPNTLCNVCGLLYAKRQVRHKGSSKEGSKGGSKGNSREESRKAASCALSWPS